MTIGAEPAAKMVCQSQEKAIKVRDVMTRNPVYCGPETNLGTAVEILWTWNCGVLPIVDSNNALEGILTDRDICIALGTRNRLSSEIRVEDVMSKNVRVCRPNDDIQTALDAMVESKVRRLPVIDEAKKLEGMLSIEDIVLRTDQNINTGGHPSDEDLISALKSIYKEQRLPEKETFNVS